VETLVEATMFGPATRYRPSMAVSAGSPLVARWRDRGWPVSEITPLPRFRDVAAARRLVRELAGVIRASGAAVVHTHGIAGQLYGGRAAARIGWPVVWHLHDCFARRWTSDGLLHRLAAAAPAHVALAVSEAVAKSWRGRLPAARLQVVHNGVMTDLVAPAPRPDAPFVVWCGRLQRWKGAHVFLDVAAAVRRRRPDARFAIVGGTLFGLDPDYPDDLHRRADALGLHDVVDWVGQVDDARPWLAGADVLVHTSVDPEPFGLVVAEAMAQGTPVVAFRQGGPAEIIVDRQTGALIAPGDTMAMADAIESLLFDSVCRRAWGDAGRARVLSHFTVGEMVRRVESAYDRARSHV
jgi:glycosyltransferase involved in cell wall biosynthesis